MSTRPRSSPANRHHPTLYATGLVNLDARIVIDMVEGNAAADQPIHERAGEGNRTSFSAWESITRGSERTAADERAGHDGSVYGRGRVRSMVDAG